MFKNFDSKKTTPLMRKNNRDARSLKFKGEPPNAIKTLMFDLFLGILYFGPTYLIIQTYMSQVPSKFYIIIIKIYCIILNIIFFLLNILMLLTIRILQTNTDVFNTFLLHYRAVRYFILVPGLFANVFFLFDHNVIDSAENQVVDFITKYYLHMTLWFIGIGFLLFDMKIAKACLQIKIDHTERFGYTFPHTIEWKDSTKSIREVTSIKYNMISEKIKSPNREISPSKSSSQYLNMDQNIKYEKLIITDSSSF